MSSNFLKIFQEQSENILFINESNIKWIEDLETDGGVVIHLLDDEKITGFLADILKIEAVIKYIKGE